MKKVLAAIVGLAIIVFVGYTHRDQWQARTSCADKLIHQYATVQPVTGAYGCLDPDIQFALKFFHNISDDKSFAKAIGSSSVNYSYLGITNDGGYTYRLDHAYRPHNVFGGAFDDIKQGKFKNVWGELKFSLLN